MIAKATLAHPVIGRLPVVDEPGRQASTGWRITEAPRGEEQPRSRARCPHVGSDRVFLPLACRRAASVPTSIRTSRWGP